VTTLAAVAQFGIPQAICRVPVTAKEFVYRISHKESSIDHVSLYQNSTKGSASFSPFRYRFSPDRLFRIAFFYTHRPGRPGNPCLES
jgi:hypothetical protein